jgi:putative hemolysin
MQTDVYLFAIGLLLLLGLDLLGVATLFAFNGASRAQLMARSEGSEDRLQKTINLSRSLPRLQASIRLYQLVLYFLMAGGLWLFISKQGPQWSVLAILGALLLPPLVVFLLEWILRGYVLGDAQKWAISLTPVARVLVFMVGPLVSIPLSITRGEESTPEGISEGMVDEIKSLVDAGQQEGVLEQEERMMIRSIFELGDTFAREIMVPRIDMLVLDVHTSLPEAVDALLSSGYTRVPVYETSVDNVLGLLYAKDLLSVWREGRQLESLRSLLRTAYFVPEAKKVDELLLEMQSRRVHMAIVVDEYGGIAGLVTLEDIVEEIFGEIQDEYDQGEELPYQELGHGEYIFQGRVDLDDFNEIFNSDLPKDEAETIGGFMYSRLGRVPVSGESVDLDNIVLTVEQVSGRRIRKVRARRILPSLENGGEESDVVG